MTAEQRGDLERRLRALGERINKIADEEARFVVVGGEAAAQGVPYPEKMRLVEECEGIVDKLQGVGAKTD
jgi:hypothetical protein